MPKKVRLVLPCAGGRDEMCFSLTAEVLISLANTVATALQLITWFLPLELHIISRGKSGQGEVHKATAIPIKDFGGASAHFAAKISEERLSVGVAPVPSPYRRRRCA